MAQDNSACKSRDPFRALHGKSISITNMAGAFRSCRNCDHTAARIDITPVGVHAGTLRCDACGHMTAYLSREHMQAMLAAHEAGEDVQ